MSCLANLCELFKLQHRADAEYVPFCCLLQIWAYAKLVPAGQPLMGPLHALMQGVPDHVVRQLADDSQHHKVGLPLLYTSLLCCMHGPA